MSRNHAAALTEADGYPAAFERIEAAVDAGETDLGKLGFWTLLARIKRDPALSAHWAEYAGRIDRKAFGSRVRFRLPVWVGVVLLAIAIAVGAVAVGVAIATEDEALAGWALVFAALDWSASLHTPAHLVVGRLAGIRFLAFFFLDPKLLIPGLKIDYASYLRTQPRARAWMHASGAIASKIAPFVALAFWPSAEAPTWAAWTIVAYGAVLIAIDVVFSVRRSDWKRFRREMRVARTQAVA